MCLDSLSPLWKVAEAAVPKSKYSSRRSVVCLFTTLCHLTLSYGCVARLKVLRTTWKSIGVPSSFEMQFPTAGGTAAGEETKNSCG